MKAASPPAATPGDGLLHPLPVASLLVLLINDHWAKGAYPGMVTGKLSDVAGLVFFPLLLQAMWEQLRPPPSGRALAVAMAMTALTFLLVKVGTPVTDLYRWGLGLAQAPFVGEWLPVALVADPTDLWALPAVLLGLLVHRGRWKAAPPLV